MPLVGEVPPPPAARTARTSAAKSTSAKLADKKPATPPDTTRRDARVATLDGYSQILQAGFLMVGWHADAETADMHGGPFLTAVADLGDHHQAFGEALDKSDAFGPYLALAVAAIPMTLQFMANHGRLDATKTNVGGIVPPDQLANQRQAKMMRAQAEMIRRQRLAEEDQMRAAQEYQLEMQAYHDLRNQANGVQQDANV
jgi:hypothetical protein